MAKDHSTGHVAMLVIYLIILASFTLVVACGVAVLVMYWRFRARRSDETQYMKIDAEETDALLEKKGNAMKD